MFMQMTRGIASWPINSCVNNEYEKRGKKVGFSNRNKAYQEENEE